MALLFLAPFACLIAVIYHIVKALRFSKKVEAGKKAITWEFDKGLWKDFILLCLRLNIGDDLKSLGSFGARFITIGVLGTALVIAVDIEKMKRPFIYFAVPFGIFIVYFVWVMGRNVLKALDHICFSDKKITLMKNGAIFNGEYIYWGKTGESGLVGIDIDDGFIDIIYFVRARSNTTHENKPDIRRLKIPIPPGQYAEAASFISSVHIKAIW